MRDLHLEPGMAFEQTVKAPKRPKETARHWLLLLAAFVCVGGSGVQAGPHDAFGGLLGVVSQARSGAVDTETDGEDAAGACATANSCYISEVEPVVQESCAMCHQQGLTADQQGARLLFTDDPAKNHAALETFVTSDGVGADWLLGKIVGDFGHGGGPVLAQGSNSYWAFADYLTLLVGANTDDGSVEASAMWSATAMESPETTLRRAGIILSGKIPTKAAINRAQSSDSGLKRELVRLMKGEGFHDFLTTGANDRLLTEGLNNGIDFQFDNRGRFPDFMQFERSLPEDRPEEFNTEEYWDRPFLDRGSANGEFRQALIREPLELIAYIVENDRSYKEVVTADYTMVNQFSAMAYRADVTFDEPMYDDDGFYDRSRLNMFKPAKNSGHIPRINDNIVDQDAEVYSIAEYHDWPHAGVLSTPAWLTRYPSTDTNRNRARARWTYYQFLGVDIEKLAPRTTDPVALADTNNPTMNNPACTVCHERMDPVAGAYQSFGDGGNYLDQWEGLDSLSDTYKNQQRPDGELFELVHGNSEDSGAYVFHELSQAFSTRGDGGNFAVSDATPEPCIKDEDNSTQDQYVSWCSWFSILDIAVYSDGAKVLEIKASDFEAHPGFSVDTDIDNDSGEARPRGYVTQSPQGSVYMLYIWDSWVSFDLDLPEGEYEVVVNLGTQIDDGHPDSTLTAGLLWSEGFYSDDNQYQHGDTWYRDMRSPGFNGKAHSSSKDSIQWLGQQIANDPRFAKATVKFWWPSVFGSEVLVAPVDRSLPDYEAQLLAFNAQEALVEELATAFAAGGFKVKSLLADMMLSPWFRTTAIVGSLSETQEAALETVGRGRQLTPEELDRKNRAIFGRTWGERWGHNAHDYKPQTNFTGRRSYAAFYGGIDGASITKRNREQTSLMSNVTERMAVELSCQVVLDDFNKPREQRTVFTEVERTTIPSELASDNYVLQRSSGPKDQWQHHERSLDFTTGDGDVLINLQDTMDCVRDEENSVEGEWQGWCSHMGLEGIDIYSNDNLVWALSASEFENNEAFVPQTHTDNETGEVRLNGWFNQDQFGMAFYSSHTGSSISFKPPLEAGKHTVVVKLLSSLNEGHPNDSITVAIDVLSEKFDPSTSGAKAVAKQLDALYLRATGSVLDADVKNTWLEAFQRYATAASMDDWWYGGHCDTWSLWDNSEPRTVQQNDQLHGDPQGGMRAWTMMLHALMTSYPYLHD
jgi:hypothetical protein